MNTPRLIGYAVATVLASVAANAVAGDWSQIWRSPGLWTALAFAVLGELVARTGNPSPRWQHAVVTICSDGEPIGLGCVITPRRVLTTRDVLARANGTSSCTVTFPHLPGGEGLVKTVQVAAASGDVVALDVHPQDRLPRGVLPFRFAEAVTLAPVRLSGVIAREPSTAASPTEWVTARVTSAGDPLRLAADTSARPGDRDGFRGGPVVDQLGRIVGIVTSAAVDDGRFVVTARPQQSFATLNRRATPLQRVVRVVTAAAVTLPPALASAGRVAVRHAPRAAGAVGQYARAHRSTATTAGAVVVAVLATLVVTRLLNPAAQPCTELTVAISTEKDNLVRELTADFAHGRTVRGRCVEIRAYGLTSGGAMEAMARRGVPWDEEIVALTVEPGQMAGGVPQAPDVWLPTSTMWGDLLDDATDVRLEHLGPVTASVMAVAMPDGGDDVSWASLTTGGADFRLGRDRPLYSTSGLATTVMTYDAAARAVHGDTAIVTTGMVTTDEAVIDEVRRIESSVADYGREATQYLADLYCGRVEPLDALVIQEQMVWNYNHGRPDGGDPGCTRPDDVPARLAAVQPTDGTIHLDHPFYVLPWADDDQRAVAEELYAFLAAPSQQGRFVAEGFRSPNDPAALTEPLLGTAVGDVARLVPVPAPDALRELRLQWDSVRKNAQVLLLVDISGSMSGERFDEVKGAARRAAALLDADDEVALWTFDSTVHTAAFVPVGDGAALRTAIDDLTPTQGEGGRWTALVQALTEAHRFVEGTVPADAADERVQAIVVLTDGGDNPAPTAEQSAEPDPGARRALRRTQLARQMGALADEVPGRERLVRVFTIPYGRGSDECLLQSVSQRTGAGFYGASRRPENIDDVLVAVFAAAVGSDTTAADLPSREARTPTEWDEDCRDPLPAVG